MPPRVIRHTLRVVAGGRCNHSMRALVRIECEKLIERPALFERPRTLLVIQLEEDRVLRQPGKCLRVRARRNPDVCTNPAERRVNVGELDHCQPGRTALKNARTLLPATK